MRLPCHGMLSVYRPLAACRIWKKPSLHSGINYKLIIRKITGHRVFKNASALALMQLVNYVAPLVVLLHLTHVLGVETYGVVAFSAGIAMMGLIIMDFGYSLSATNKVSLYRAHVGFVLKL